MKSEHGLLMLEPEGTEIPDEPLIDELTRRVAATLRACTPGPAYMGKHMCICGALSGCEDLYTIHGFLTNSLAVHYMAWHRAEVPRTQLAKVLLLPAQFVMPTEDELARPKRTGLAFQAWLYAQRQHVPSFHNSDFDFKSRPQFFDISTVYKTSDTMLAHFMLDEKGKKR